MFMRYQWGLGVGHTYTHPSHKAADTTANFEDQEEEEIQDQGICDSDSDHSSLESDSGEDSEDECSDNDSTLDYEN